MTRAHYHLNLNLDDPNEREAWHILQSKRHGSRTTFLVEAILQQDRQKQLEERLRAIIREELAQAHLAPSAGASAVAASKEELEVKKIPRKTIDFLQSLAYGK